jgi:hypothetical protein
MPRLEDTGNTAFPRYLGDPILKPIFEDYEGDTKKRFPSGKRILSNRGRLVNQIRKGGLLVEPDKKVSEPGIQNLKLNDKVISRPQPRRSSMWARSPA